MIFRMFSEPSSSEESLEERLEQTEHHLDEMRKERGAPLEDGSAPTEHVPDDRDHRD
jgi:hypothetical protein